MLAQTAMEPNKKLSMFIAHTVKCMYTCMQLFFIKSTRPYHLRNYTYIQFYVPATKLLLRLVHKMTHGFPTVTYIPSTVVVNVFILSMSVISITCYILGLGLSAKALRPRYISFKLFSVSHEETV